MAGKDKEFAWMMQTVKRLPGMIDRLTHIIACERKETGRQLELLEKKIREDCYEQLKAAFMILSERVELLEKQGSEKN